MYMWLYVYMKNSFPKRIKRHSKIKWACNANAKFIDCVLEKSFSQVYIYICTYLWRALFQNIISEIVIDITTSISGLMLITFWKRTLHMYIYIHVYMYICIICACAYICIYLYIILVSFRWKPKLFWGDWKVILF